MLHCYDWLFKHSAKFLFPYGNSKCHNTAQFSNMYIIKWCQNIDKTSFILETWLFSISSVQILCEAQVSNEPDMVPNAVQTIKIWNRYIGIMFGQLQLLTIK